MYRVSGERVRLSEASGEWVRARVQRATASGPAPSPEERGTESNANCVGIGVTRARDDPSHVPPIYLWNESRIANALGFLPNTDVQSTDARFRS